MPAYTPNVPQAAQTIASSQNQILQNFIQIQTWTNVDHVQISGAGGNEGKHAKVSLIEQPYVAGGNFTPAIDAATGVGTLGIYAARNTSNAGPSRMWAVIPRKTSTTPTYTAANIPFTLSSLTDNVGASDQDNWTYLPSGMIIQNGAFVLAVQDNGSITPTPAAFTFPIPFPNKVLTIIISPFIGTTFSAVAYPTLPANTNPSPIAGFTARCVRTSGTSTGQSGTFRYIAIGF